MNSGTRSKNTPQLKKQAFPKQLKLESLNLHVQGRMQLKAGPQLPQLSLPSSVALELKPALKKTTKLRTVPLEHKGQLRPPLISIQEGEDKLKCFSVNLPELTLKGAGSENSKLEPKSDPSCSVDCEAPESLSQTIENSPSPSISLVYSFEYLLAQYGRVDIY